MAIVSLPFVFLALTAIVVFYLLGNKYRVPYLAILSACFVASYSYELLIYILAYTAVNFYLGIKIHDAKNKKALFRTGILINLLQLILLRYSSFALDPLISILNSNFQVSKLADIIVPIGISYFTLQGIGYLVNIKMGWEKPEKRFPDFFLYITFFPKFLSGPIERSNHFLTQLKGEIKFNEQQVNDGLRIALIGFFKKVAIANQLAPIVLNTYHDISTADPYSLWFGLLVTPLYLYFDFSGYTDIAIGLAKTMGIDLLPNFERPFFAENVTVFWKRFHMSLSLWFGDYVFRQLSFKHRKWGVFSSTYAVFVTWTLFGIWHGAGWNFMVLGLMQALAINYEFFTKRLRYKIFAQIPEQPGKWIGRFFTFLFYGVSLVFFFSPDLQSVGVYLSKLTDIGGPIMFGPLSRAPYAAFLYIFVVMSLEFLKNDRKVTFERLERYWNQDNLKLRILRWSVYSLMIIIILGIGQAEQFVYINF